MKRSFLSHAPQTFGNVLHLYGVHTSKEAVLLPAALARGVPQLHRMFVFLQHSIPLDKALCNDVTGDSRSVLLGMADGSLLVYSWAAQVRALQEAIMKLWGSCDESGGGGLMGIPFPQSSLAVMLAHSKPICCSVVDGV